MKNKQHMCQMKLFASLLFILSLLYPSTASSVSFQQQEPVRVAVLDLEATNVDQVEANIISDRLRFYVGNNPVFQLIERDVMMEIMEESGFQISGACDTDECVVEVGRILGASKMIAGSIGRVGTIYTLQIRIVDIETASIEHQAFSDVNGIEEVLGEATATVAKELADRISGQAGTIQPAGPVEEATLPEAFLTLDSSLSGARLKIDGIRQPEAIPTRRLSLRSGSHEIIVTSPGYAPWRQTVDLAGGDDRVLTVSLVPKSRITAGFLSILPGAGHFYSRRPFMGTVMVLLNASVAITLESMAQEYTRLEKEQGTLQTLYNGAGDLETLSAAGDDLLNNYNKWQSVHKKMRNVSWLQVGLWLYNVLDAVAFMPRLSPANPELSSPIIGFTSRSGSARLSISIPF